MSQAAIMNYVGGAGQAVAGNLFYHAALLAGLGPRAEAAAARCCEPKQSPSPGDGRTCIDGGSSLMFSVLAPGGRALRVISRQGPERGGVMPWQLSYFGQGEEETWYAETYMGDSSASWQRALAAATRAGDVATFRRMHAIVGPHSRLYSVSWSGDDERPLARIGWQLDRTLPADRALEAIGCTGAWPAAAAFWASLLGRPVDPRRGPWSLDLTLGSVPRWRLGSTNWARDVEDSGKRTRLAAVVDQRGGDRRFAEGLYKLIQSAVPPGRPRAIGRAVELELVEGAPGTAEFYICVP